MTTDSDKGECFYVACSVVALLCGIWLITAGAWWGWILAPVGALGLIFAAMVGF